MLFIQQNWPRIAADPPAGQWNIFQNPLGKVARLSGTSRVKTPKAKKRCAFLICAAACLLEDSSIPATRGVAALVEAAEMQCFGRLEHVSKNNYFCGRSPVPSQLHGIPYRKHCWASLEKARRLILVKSEVGYILFPSLICSNPLSFSVSTCCQRQRDCCSQ